LTGSGEFSGETRGNTNESPRRREDHEELKGDLFFCFLRVFRGSVVNPLRSGTRPH
jgi:hypothetical protein